MAVSTRAQVITRRTYNRPTSDDGKQFETWQETVARVIDHQEWLWQRAAGRELTDVEYGELYDLEQLMLDRKVAMSGRTLWLGGTDVAKTREASQFNCSFTHVETVYDVVDCLWLLLQGCGVGFKPIVGTLNGFSKPIKNIKVIRSTRTAKGGNEYKLGILPRPGQNLSVSLLLVSTLLILSYSTLVSYALLGKG
jgi:ribonucleoside-triphosphate reductase